MGRRLNLINYSALSLGAHCVLQKLGFSDAATTWKGALFPEYRAWLPGFVGKMIAFVLSIALLFSGAAALFRALGLRPGSQGD